MDLGAISLFNQQQKKLFTLYNKSDLMNMFFGLTMIEKSAGDYGKSLFQSESYRRG